MRPLIHKTVIRNYASLLLSKNYTIKRKTVNNCTVPRSTPACQIICCKFWRMPPIKLAAWSILPTRHHRVRVPAPGAYSLPSIARHLTKLAFDCMNSGSADLSQDADRNSLRLAQAGTGGNATHDRGCRATSVSDAAASAVGMSMATLLLMARCRANSSRCARYPAQNLKSKIRVST